MKKLGDGKKLTLKNIGVEKLIVLLVVGVLLLILSKPMLDADDDTATEHQVLPSLSTEEGQANEKVYVEQMENKLEDLLSHTEGVGKVKVLITLKSSRELVVNKDQPYSTSRTEEKDSEGGERLSTDNSYEEQTVLTGNGTGSNEPFVIKELEPEISGIVILAEGGDQPNVKSDLTNAAEVLFNIPAHRIKVMKMVTN